MKICCWWPCLSLLLCWILFTWNSRFKINTNSYHFFHYTYLQVVVILLLFTQLCVHDLCILVDRLNVTAGIYMFKVKDTDTRAMQETCSKLIIKAPEWLKWHFSSAFILNVEQLKILLVFPLLTLNT